MWRFAIIVAGLLAVGAAAVFLPSVLAHPSQPARPVSQPPKDGEIRAGSRVIVGMVEDDNPEQLICMVREIKDREEVERLVATRDTEGMRQALGHMRATLIPNRSPAVLLQVGNDLCRVRILEGAVRGREGWLPPEYLLREPR